LWKEVVRKYRHWFRLYLFLSYCIHQICHETSRCFASRPIHVSTMQTNTTHIKSLIILRPRPTLISQHLKFITLFVYSNACILWKYCPVFFSETMFQLHVIFTISISYLMLLDIVIQGEQKVFPWLYDKKTTWNTNILLWSVLMCCKKHFLKWVTLKICLYST
jgi:hypothetical protein